MRTQHIYGMPQRCCTRNCKGKFYRESHLGWLPKSESEVIAVMRCSKCKDTFAVVQMISIAHEYYQKLQKDPELEKRNNTLTGPITTSEVEQMRKKMDADNILTKLYEGSAPGTPGYSE